MKLTEKIIHFFKYKIRRDYFFFNLRYRLQMSAMKRLPGTVKRQEKDPKKIPVIVISFNQLFYLKKLIDFLLTSGYQKVIIADNASTFPPLLQYLNSISEKVEVIRLEKNHGHMVVWKRPKIFRKYTRGFYAVTDADVVPSEGCPHDFVAHFKKLLNNYKRVTKVGFSLKLDIPNTHPYRSNILKWESKFWEKETEEGNYYADIDTTFALYRPRSFKWIKTPFMNAVRTRSPYTAIHGGWFVDPDNLSEEQRYYMKTANNSSSWRVDEHGKLVSKDFSPEFLF